MPEPTTDPCARYGQHRPLFPADPAWGDVPTPLCSPCWQQYADARANGSFVNFGDAFDNADDDALLRYLGGAL